MNENIKLVSSTIICIWIQFIIGVEFMAVTVSLLFYLKEHFSSENVNVIYTVIVAATLIPGLFGGIIGSIVDKTRRLKEMTCILLIFMIVGNLLYTVYFSIWCLIIGRLLGGLSMVLRSCIAGELARWFENPARVLFFYQMAFSIGFIIGPSTAAWFTDVDFQIGNLSITKDNFIGVFMAVLSLMTLILVLLGMFNMSSKVDNNSKINADSSAPTYSIKDTCKDYDISLVILANGTVFFGCACFELIIPLIGMNELRMEMSQIGIAIFIALAAYVTLMFLCWERFFSGKYGALRGVILCLFSGCYVCLFLMLPKFVEFKSNFLKSLLVVLATFFNSLGGMSMQIPARELLFQMVPSDMACYLDGIRSGVAISLFAFAGYLFASFIFKASFYGIPILGLIMLFVALLVFQRRHSIYKRTAQFTS